MVRLAYNPKDKIAKIIFKALDEEVRVQEIHMDSVTIMWVDDSCYTGIRDILRGMREHFPEINLSDVKSKLGEVNAKISCLRD